jgi:hypothetical protein
VRTATRPFGAGHAFGAVQPHLPAVASAGLGALALAAVILPELWSLTEHLNTMAHEGAHAAMGSATGGRVIGVELSSDGDGLTWLIPSGPGGRPVAGRLGARAHRRRPDTDLGDPDLARR